MHGQTRARGAAAARPLLSFTAQDAPRPHLTHLGTRQPAPLPRRRPRRVTVVYLLPLVFVFALLAFASYTFLYTLCYVRLTPVACGQVKQADEWRTAPHRTGLPLASSPPHTHSRTLRTRIHRTRLWLYRELLDELCQRDCQLCPLARWSTRTGRRRRRRRRGHLGLEERVQSTREIRTPNAGPTRGGRPSSRARREPRTAGTDSTLVRRCTHRA